MNLRVALFTLFLAHCLETPASDFPCPDELSRELYSKIKELNEVHPLLQAESGYARVIKQASARSMDDLALRLACASLARRTFRTNCSLYGYECPHPGDDLSEWPARINDWIPELKANVSALRSCPDAYVREDSKLPVVRATPVLADDIVDEQITGWVTLKLDIDEFGKVGNVRVESSTSTRLEESALEAARKFRYQRKLVDSRFVAVRGVSTVVFFHYWDLANVAGCYGSDNLTIQR